jgi:phage gpG-like protein
MAVGFVSYSVVNDKAFLAQIERAKLVTKDLRIPFRQIVKDFHRSEKAIFNLQSAGQYPDFTGPKVKDTWKTPGLPEMRTRDGELTAYANFKKRFSKQKKPYPLLKFTGRLEDSVTSEGPDSIVIVEPLALAIGTKVPYGKFHQSDAQRSKIPLRKFLFVGPESIKFASDKDITGRLQRWNDRINTFILRQMGLTFEQATGKAPKGGG